MNMSTRALGLMASIVISSAAMADASSPGFYLGVGYTSATIDLDVVDKEADVGALFARGGYQFNEYVAVEARLGVGVDEDKIYGVEVELEEAYGAYLKAGLPTTVGLYPYVLFGVTQVEVEASIDGYSETDSDSDISYGIGADYWFTSNVSAGLEFASFYDEDGDEVTGVTFGMNFKF